MKVRTLPKMERAIDKLVYELSGLTKEAKVMEEHA
jgi:hypothetical protein